MTIQQPLLRVEDVSAVYGGHGVAHTVLRDVSFTIGRGEFVALIGPSGSGKSTLLNVVGLQQRSTAGTLQLGSEWVVALDDDTLARRRNESIGFVFQSYHLLPRLSALENVALPLAYAGLPRRLRQPRAAQALARVGLADRLMQLPSQLSGGEQQRVAIARAIVNSPELLLADEPTGALDSNTGDSILDLLQTLREGGMAIFMVTHDMRIARRADRIMTLRDGRVVESSEPDAARPVVTLATTIAPE